MTGEGLVKQLIKKWLDTLGSDLWRYMPVPSLYGKRTVDYHLCYRGRFFVIEAKAPGKEPTRAQEREMREVEEAGGIAFWVDGPVRLQLVKDWVELVRNET